MHVRLAIRAEDVAACRALVARVYAEKYDVTMSDGPADPDGGYERFPDQWVLGELDGELIACAGLYVRDTYAERYGMVTRADLDRVVRAAGSSVFTHSGAPRPVVEFTKIVVRPDLARHGYGRRFLAASHALAFLGSGGSALPLVLVCARLTTFRLWEEMGIQTRFLREFPNYRNHARYRSPADPMETRVIVPELDIPAAHRDAPLPRDVAEAALRARSAHAELDRRSGDPAITSVALVVGADQVRAHWPRCWLTAEYLSRSVAPEHPDLAVVIDELLENAVKFAAEPNDTVRLRVERLSGALRVAAANRTDRRHAEDLDASVRRVLTADPEALFVQQLERSARSVRRDESRLGFVTLCVHAGAHLGVQIREANSGLYDVTVMALLRTEGVAA